MYFLFRSSHYEFPEPLPPSGDLREKSDLSPLTSDSTSQDVQPVGGGATGVTNVDMNEDTNVSNVKLLQL